MIDLTEFDDAYAQEPEQEDPKIPDGRYQVRILRAFLNHARTGAPMLTWEMEIISPQHTGRRLWRNNVISSNTLKWLKRDLTLAGLQLARFSELTERLDDLRDVTLEVTQQTREGKANIYFNRKIALSVQYDDSSVPF